MPLTNDDRRAFLDLLPDLGDDADPRAAVAFGRAHRDEILDELAAVPGMDQVRAGALRLLPSLLPDPAAWAPHLAAAGSALLVPVAESPVDRMLRHPAWIGLALLELSELQDSWEDGEVDRAIELAGRAFETIGDGGVGEGEVAWAMAEQAEDVGWSSRAEELLEEAIERPFADPARRAEALLLAAIRRDQRGEDAVPLLDEALAIEVAEDRPRTHAAWVLAHVHRREGRDDLALAALEHAAASVDRDQDAEVAARIDALLGTWR